MNPFEFANDPPPPRRRRRAPSQVPRLVALVVVAGLLIFAVGSCRAKMQADIRRQLDWEQERHNDVMRKIERERQESMDRAQIREIERRYGK